MYEKILIVSEITANHDRIIQALGSLKKLGVRTCLLYQYINPLEANENIATFLLDTYRASLNRQKQLLTDEGFTVETVERGGLLSSRELFDLAREQGCSLVVTGLPRHTLVGGALFGGASSQLIYRATLPLLIIRTPDGLPRGDEATAACPLLTSHILFPTDFSANARLAFEQVLQMVAAGIRKVTLIHVQDKSKIDPHLTDKLSEFNEKDTARLKELARELQAAGPVDVEFSLPYGSPTSEILKVIRERDVSLVVMGSQGRGFIEEIYLGSVSHNIARHSTASVLLIPIKQS